MKKKLVAVLLTAVMVVTALAGCGGSGSSSSSSSSDSSSSDSKTEEAAPAEVDADGKVNGIMYAEGLPIVDEGDYTFSIFVDDSSSTGEFVTLDALKEQTNVDIDLKYFPYESATERLNLDLNSGDYADVIGGWTLSDNMILTYGVDQGIFIPLEDLFAQYAPNISAVLDLPGVREKMTAPDGHIYSIPYVVDDTTVGYTPFINTRWLENVGMDMPTTTDEFEAVLQAFKDQDANGNGDPNDEIPFSTDPNNKHLEAMAGYFGVPMNNVGFTVTEDGETAWAAESDGYRQFLSWFNKLYEKGLIDTEISTQDSATWEGKGNRDLYGCSIAYGSQEFSGLEITEEKGEFDFLPVLNADNGGIWLRDTTGNSVYRTQAVITDNAEHPEIIVRWFDTVFNLENGICISKGPIGVMVRQEGDDPTTFAATADGIVNDYYVVDSSTMSEEDQNKYGWGNLWPQALPKFMPLGFKFKEDHPLYDEKSALQEYYEPYLTKNIINSFWVDLDDVEIYSEYATSIKDYFTQQQALFIAGQQDVDDDAVWQAYCDGFDGLNLDKYLEIRGVTKKID